MPKEKDSFVFLDDDAVDLLEADQNAHSAYVDLLTLLNDLLISYGSEPLHPRFNVEQIGKELNNLVHAFPSGQTIGMIARKNIEVSKNLLKLSVSIAPGLKNKSTTVQSAVNSFLADILKQYDFIRVIRSRGGVVSR